MGGLRRRRRARMVDSAGSLEKKVFLGTEGGSLVSMANPVRRESSAGTLSLACRASSGWTAILVRRES
jgi:hypothetical protein